MSEKTNCVFKKPVAYSKSKRMYCNFFFLCAVTEMRFLPLEQCNICFALRTA